MCCGCMNRREFLATAGALAATGAASSALAGEPAPPAWTPDGWNPDRPLRPIGKPLSVQPILMYRTPTKRDMASWKSWGGVQTDQAATEEAQRIAKELQDLAKTAGFPLEVRPVLKVKSPADLAQAKANPTDVTIVYPATGSGDLLRACLPEKGHAIIFVRHRSGPVYYWYEALSVRYLSTDDAERKKPTVHDVVVDDMAELAWRLRALFAVKNFLGARVVALGGAGGKYAPAAPKVAQTNYKFDIVDLPYKDFEPRLRRALADGKCTATAAAWADRCLAMPDTTLATKKDFVINAFVLYGLFKDILREYDAEIITINSCMGAIIPMSRTTACLTLGLLNDEGYLALCESDFVILPPGVLLWYVTGRPVFMHNSTFPHQAIVTCAHCACPRRLDGHRYEPVKIVTHYESEYGAAPKVDMPPGQKVTFIDPEYATGRWLGFTGTVKANPFYEICRSQQDVQIDGNWQALLKEVRDSHWMMAYGDHLAPAGYAARKIGIRWEGLGSERI
ncbi:MAG: sugar isomerase [Phycisphaerae bacterium]|nr:sugar isomerase [Phycisphaerae bacterium]